MKKYYSFSTVLVVFLGLLLISGCSKDNPTEPDTTEVSALDKPYGGYSTSDELPAFGLSELSEDFQDDQVVNDAVASEPSFISAVDSQRVNAYFIRIVWGLLEFDSTATTVYDWSGSASVNRGVLGVMRAIRFEPGDRILLPRPDSKIVEWISHTMVSFDGISLVILDRDSTETAGEFSFNTGMYSRTFSFDELDSLEMVETLPSGQQFSIVAYNRQVIPLGGGFFDGKWIKSEDRDGGRFRGRWINRLGTIAGHLQGIWGINNQGMKVFHGKYILMNGQFGGLISGLWGYRDNDATKGWMSGRWVNRNLTKIGELHGHWKVNPDNERHGFFHGQWKRTRP